MTLELLQSIKEIYGPNAPDKLLFSVFERKTAKLKKEVKGDTVAERAKWLAKEREKEGFMSQFLEEEKDGPQILECHTPILNLLDQYPIVARLEQDHVEAILGTPVRREEIRTSGLYECAFYFAL
jgi:predicted ArsR family transcriptional regulator